MTDTERIEFIERLERYKNKLSSNKEEAQNFLINAGIYTSAGVLSENYSNLCIPHDQV
jgi:hypothetical protein